MAACAFLFVLTQELIKATFFSELRKAQLSYSTVSCRTHVNGSHRKSQKGNLIDHQSTHFLLTGPRSIQSPGLLNRQSQSFLTEDHSGRVLSRSINSKEKGEQNLAAQIADRLPGCRLRLLVNLKTPARASPKHPPVLLAQESTQTQLRSSQLLAPSPSIFVF